MSVLTVLSGCFTIRQPLSAQSLDWGKIFDEAVIPDRAVNDRARDRMFNEIMPKLTANDGSFLAAEIGGIVAQLDRKNDGIRQQASGVLSVLAQFRPDSSSTLAPAFSALMVHVRDTAPRIRTNSLNALCALRPEIPEEQMQFLIKLASDSDESLASRALFGVARMASFRIAASEAMNKSLLQTDPYDRRMAAVRAIAAARVTSPALVRSLGSLLDDKDATLVHTILEAMEELGGSAIAANIDQLNHVINASSDSESVALARRLVTTQIGGR